MNLKERRQWVVWRYGEPRPDGKRAKVPCSPRTGRQAGTDSEHMWGTFQEVVAAHADGSYDGIGFVFTAKDPYLGVDLDGCRDGSTGELADWARAIVDRLDTYTEVSPSQTGVKLFMRAQMPGSRHKRVLGTGQAIEVYDNVRFFTVTGQRVAGTATGIEARHAEVAGWYAETFPAQQASDATYMDFDGATNGAWGEQDDEALVEQMLRSRNGAKLRRLWEGDTSDYHGDASAADLALCRALAFWTSKDGDRMDRLFRQSNLFREKWERADYRDRTIQLAIKQQVEVYVPGKREDQRARFTYPWQQREETPTQRKGLQLQLSVQLGESVRQYLDAPDGSLLVVTAPPGSGKTYRVAEIGFTRDLAFIAERHNQVGSVAALPHYVHILPPGPDNCPFSRDHAILAAKGYNTLGWHREHACVYSRQFDQVGKSTLYMVEHVPTPYPARHTGGVIIDELNLPKWLMEYQFTSEERHSARLSAESGSSQERLLDAVERVVQNTERAARGQRYPAPLHGQALFDALDAHCQGQLAELVRTLADEGLGNPRLALSPEALRDPDNQPSNVLEHLVNAMRAELGRWQQGEAWNSAVRVAYTALDGGHQKAWVLGITERRRLQGEAAPGRVLLDATADVDVLRRLFGTEVRVVSEDVTPPPHIQHLHYARRYAKSSMGARHGRDRTRAIAQARYLLKELQQDGDRPRVGLITYKECVEAMGKALGIPEALRGWFWAERGSNAKQDCDILLVVGTPTLPPDEVARLGRALYQDDQEPILDGTAAEGEHGLHHYLDPRLQQLSEYLTNAELTQCAHRSRPLWHDGRVVVTFSLGEVAYLPMTTRIDGLPELDADGSRADVQRQEAREEALERAHEAILARGERLTVAALRREAGVSAAAAQAYVKQRQAEADEEESCSA
jgi:hypothetical protein